MMGFAKYFLLVAFGYLALALPFDSEAAPAKPAPKKMKLTSTAFKEGQPIPAKYTCDDKNVSPPLRWSDIPKNAKTLFIMCEDPDAPGGAWLHWTLFNLPVAVTEMGEAVPNKDPLPHGALQGLNDFQNVGYGGPCPPPGKAHRYIFKIYALDSQLQLKSGAGKKELLKTIEDHIIGEGQLMGTYQRK